MDHINRFDGEPYRLEIVLSGQDPREILKWINGQWIDGWEYIEGFAGVTAPPGTPIEVLMKRRGRT